MKRLLILAVLCVPLAGCNPEERDAPADMKARIELATGKPVAELTADELKAAVSKDVDYPVQAAWVTPEGTVRFQLPPIGGEIAKVVVDTTGKAIQDNPTPAVIPGLVVALAIGILGLFQKRQLIGVKK